jgi:predicted nucleic acid-binding protein
MPFVLDNSVVTGWYIEDQATDYTEAIAAKLETDRAIVPALWQLEFANVLKTACTRGKLPIDTARQVVDAICALPIEIDQAHPGPRQLFELAMRYNLSSYDAAYLELAMRHGLSLACQDGKLRQAAEAAGIGLL